MLSNFGAASQKGKTVCKPYVI